jgi:hypothetical protein
MASAAASSVKAAPACVGVQVLSPDGTQCVDPPLRRFPFPLPTVTLTPSATPTPTVTVTPSPTPVACRRDEFFDRLRNRCVLIIDRDRDRPPSTDTTKIINGDCTTVITTTTDYDRSVRHWNSVADRYRGLRTLNSVQRSELDTAFRDRQRAFDLYDRDRRVLSSTNTTCKQPVPAPVTVVAAPPPVVYSAPSQVYSTPRGSAETGSW